MENRQIDTKKAVRAIFISLLTVAIFPYAGGNRHSSSKAETGYSEFEQTAGIKSDGPYVYWGEDGEATIFYLCDSLLLSENFRASDTIKFKGLCSDSSISYKIPVTGHMRDDAVYNGISRIAVISDIHGEFEYMADILKKCGVMNDHNDWIFGDGHLVINGDIVDRGNKVTECLWLAYRLEQQAPGYGGRVHFLLGNHELMVLGGDLRYVAPVYQDGITKTARISYDKLFGPMTEFGRWLRTRNTVIRINDIIFVHGGISPDLMNRFDNIAQINDAVLRDIEILPYKKIRDSEKVFIYGGHGPLWYRGLLMEDDYPVITSEQLDGILQRLQASSIIVGHTLTDKVRSHFGGRVYSVGVEYDMLLSLQMLIWEDGNVYRITGDGTREALK